MKERTQSTMQKLMELLILLFTMPVNWFSSTLSQCEHPRYSFPIHDRNTGVTYVRCPECGARAQFDEVDWCVAGEWEKEAFDDGRIHVASTMKHRKATA